MTNELLFGDLKVNDDKEKNLNEQKELAALVTEVFERNEYGKRLLVYLKDLYISDRYKAALFPTHSSILSQFGSVEAYVGFRSGQANVIFHFEELIDQFKKEAKTTRKENKK